MRLISLAWRNLWRHKKRSLLTVGAMVFCNALLIFMIGLQIGNYRLMLENSLSVLTGHLQIQRTDYLDQAKLRLTISNYDTLLTDTRAALGADAIVVPHAMAGALLSTDDRSYGAQILGVEPSIESNFSTLAGAINQGRWLKSGPEILLGEKLAKNLNVEVGGELTLLGGGIDGSFAANVVEVVGIVSASAPELSRSLAIMPLQEFQFTFSAQDQIHVIAVRLPSWEQTQAAINTLTPLVVAEDDLVLRDWDALMPGLKQAIISDVVSALFIYLILAVVIVFSVLNTQLMAVVERRREFGTLLALGVRPGQLSQLVVIETALLGLLGLTLGVAAGLALNLYLGSVGLQFDGMDEMAAKFNLPPRMYPEISWFTTLAGPALIFLGSMVASIWPSLKARFLPILAGRGGA